jgi:hypothetical protein
LASTQKKSAEGGGFGGDRWSRALPRDFLSPAPLAPCGRGVGGEVVVVGTQAGRAEQTRGEFFGVRRLCPQKPFWQPLYGQAMDFMGKSAPAAESEVVT